MQERPAAKTGSGQGEVSSRDNRQASLTVSRKGQTCADILCRQLRKIPQDLLGSHTGSQIIQQVGRGDAVTPRPSLRRLGLTAQTRSLPPKSEIFHPSLGRNKFKLDQPVSVDAVGANPGPGLKLGR
jgi:hypothetical protein